MDSLDYRKRNRILDFLSSFTVVEVLIILVIIGLLCAMAFGAFHNVKGRDDLYEAWCKLENRRDITREEWNDLRRAGLLNNRK